MNIDEIVAVSGIPGLHKMVTNRSNGLVVEDLDTGKVRFASSRKHQFTPLASIAIYVDSEEESVELKKVFQKMLEEIENTPPPTTKSSNDELMNYLESILPEYDRDQVYPSDVKKLIKWFNFLNGKGLIDLEADEVKDETPTEETED